MLDRIAQVESQAREDTLAQRRLARAFLIPAEEEVDPQNLPFIREAVEIYHGDARVLALVWIARAETQSGNQYAADKALKDAFREAESISNRAVQAEAFARIACTQVKIGQREAARQTLAWARFNLGACSSDSEQARALTELACALIKADQAEQAVAMAALIPLQREDHLPAIAEALAEPGDREHFKQLVLPCVRYPKSAVVLCGLLALLYPEQVTAIAKKLSDVSP